jgi:hypothetical protein
MKTNTIHLSAAFRALVPADSGQFSGILLDPRARVAVATDGAAIAIIPFPGDFTVERLRFIPTGPDPLDADNSTGVSHAEHEEWGWEGIEQMMEENPPVYRIIIEPARLLALSQAMGTGDSVTLEFRDAETPVKVTAAGARGYLMPAGGEGLLIAPSSAETASAAPAKESLPPPSITSSEERGTLEIHFTGKPEKSILEALKSPALAFRYSGERGTKRGVPPRTWYGPDNPFTREKVSGILGTEIAA